MLAAGALAALEDTVQVLREQLKGAERRADEAIRRADAADEDRRTAQTLADQSMALLIDAGAAITEERRRADALRAQIDAGSGRSPRPIHLPACARPRHRSGSAQGASSRRCGAATATSIPACLRSLSRRLPY